VSSKKDSPQLQPHQQRVVDRISRDDQPGLIVAHGLGSGKCVRGDTPILTDRGLLQIQDLFPKGMEVDAEVTLDGGGYQVLSLVNGKTRWSAVRARYAQRLSASERTIHVVTERGSEVCATGAHPLLVLRAGVPTWVPAREVAVGEWVVMPDLVDGSPSPTRLDSSLAVCAAWLTTEGWEDSKKRGSFVITQHGNRPMLESLHQWLRATYGVGRIRESGHDLVACSRALADDLQAWGHTWGLKSAHKRLPYSMLSGGFSMTREVLRICWEAEGHISAANAEITSASRFLMEQYRYLLLQLGGRSSCRAKWSIASNGTGPYRKYWRSSVSGEDLEALALAVRGTKKGRKLEVIAGRKRNPNTGVPVDWLYKFLDLSPKFFGCTANNRRSVSRASALRMLEKLQWLETGTALDSLRLAVSGLGGTARSYAQRNLRVAERRSEVRVARERLYAIVYGPYRFEQVESTTPGSAGGLVYDVEVDSDVYDHKNYVGGYGGWYLHNTLTSIAAQKALGVPSQVVAPAALLGNYSKEQKKHYGKGAKPVDLVSMQQAARTGELENTALRVVDEAHRARDPGTATYRALRDSPAEKRLLLTGSPFYNHPSDIAPLLRIAAGTSLVPEDKAEFTSRYIYDKPVKPGLFDRFVHGATGGTVATLRPERAEELRGIFSKWVDHHPGTREHFPEVEHVDVDVPMSDGQRRVYDTVMDAAPSWVAAKVRRGLPPDKQEAKQLNAFLSGARQISNSTAGFIPETDKAEEPKIQKAFENLKKELDSNPRSKAVVYSNFLQAGINPYKAHLQSAGIPFGEFTGEMGRAQRDQLVRDYNDNKIRALLLSSAGGEGLDLKGTRLLQVLEPHWNREKLRQVEGRGARYMSHADLPEEERKLRIENYMSSLPEGTMGRLWRTVSGREKDKSVDQYLAQMSNDKDALIGQFKGLLPQHATPGTKVANRSSEEWRRLTAAGHHEDAANLARRYAEMGNSPRYLRDISLGGVEAGVDQMMGRVSNPQTGAINESGVFARKLYKPDSRSSRGDYTPGLLEQKQQFTNEARALSPEAKQMVPDMYGYKTRGFGGMQRTTSDHEYIPGLREMPASEAAIANRVKHNVVDPMAAKGLNMVDTFHGRGRGWNPGNVMDSPTGPKVVDFVPEGKNMPDYRHATQYSYNNADQNSKYMPREVWDPEASNSRGGKGMYREMSGEQERHVQRQLRKEVYNPSESIQKDYAHVPDEVMYPRGKPQSAKSTAAALSAEDLSMEGTVVPGVKRPPPAAATPSVPPVAHTPAAPKAPVAPTVKPGAASSIAPRAAAAVPHTVPAVPKAPAVPSLSRVLHVPPSAAGAVSNLAHAAQGARTGVLGGMASRLGKAITRAH
jgi:intein/homing endonuclease